MPRPTRHRRSRPNAFLLVAMLAGTLLVVFAAVFLLGRAGKSRAAIEVAGQPRLRVDRSSLDLGDVRLGTTAEVSFVMTNIGDEPLRLTQAPYIEVVEGC